MTPDVRGHTDKDLDVRYDSDGGADVRGTLTRTSDVRGDSDKDTLCKGAQVLFIHPYLMAA